MCLADWNGFQDLSEHIDHVLHTRLQGCFLMVSTFKFRAMNLVRVAAFHEVPLFAIKGGREGFRLCWEQDI